MKKAAEQMDVEEMAPAGGLNNPRPETEAVQEKKPRKPSKKLQAALNKAWEDGKEVGRIEGENVARREGTGFVPWLVVVFVVGFLLARWIPAGCFR